MAIPVLVVLVAVFAAFTWKTPPLHRNIHGHPLVGTEATLAVTLTGLSPRTVTLQRAETGLEVRNDTSLAHDIVIPVPVYSLAVAGSGDAGTDDVGDVVIHLPAHGDVHLAVFLQKGGTYSVTCSGSPDGMQATLEVIDSASTPAPAPSATPPLGSL